MYISEIFKSIHGEVNGHHQGRVVGFIRLSGCNIKCSYCDTPETQYAYYGEQMSINIILAKIIKLKVKYVCITGGEPLLKADKFMILVSILHDMGMRVSVETNGTKDIRPYFDYVESLVVDYKFEYASSMLPSNFTTLREKDVIKFVIGSDEEFVIACQKVREFRAGGSKAICAMSPVVKSMPPERLVNLILGSDEDNIVFSLQIHKLLKLK